jgi:hemophore-related protein
MASRSLRNLLTVGGLTAVAALSSAIPASADSMMDALVNTTCSYGQVTAALNVQSPALAVQLRNRPDMQANLQQFLALPVDQRQQQVAEQQAANPQLQAMLAAQLGPTLMAVSKTCMNF